LHVRGVAESVTFVSHSGRVLRGTDLVLPADGGMLEIAHDPGILLCWLDQPGSAARGIWSTPPDPSKVESISLPATRELRASSGTFQISIEAPILLHVRMASPSVSLLKRGSEEPEVEVHPDTTLMDAYLPSGVTQIFLRAVGGGTLSGPVEFTSSPVTPTGEGLGPEVLLAPGDSRLYSFEVKQPGAVGVGVRASSDVVESVLLSGTGKPLGKGAVQMLNLKPGTYLLALRAPAQGMPVRARPAVVGIVPPGKGPPEEVIRKYLEPEEAPPQFTSKRRKTPIESMTKEEAETEESTGTEPPEEPPDKPPNGTR
jgi:hypothetical protein